MDESKIRLPAVAGQFYPASKEKLSAQIELLFDKQAKKIDALGCILPHAGYIYSGGVAAQTLSCINIKEKIILLGPNHTGYGAPFSIMTRGSWQTPLGEIRIDNSLAKLILERSKFLEDDDSAHSYEHSLEVELPFLQYQRTDFKIVPIVFLSQELSILKEIGRDIAQAIKESNNRNSVLIIASSDMTHYEPQAQAQKKDNEAIQAIMELDEDKLMKRIQQLNISMCGCAPVATMLSIAKSLGAKSARLIKYQTSAIATGDTTSVVGYAGIIIY